MMYVIKKFFKEVEEGLSENTKLEIAVWLLGVKTADKVQSWPDTFAKVFDRVFGKNHLSWRCFWRSAIASFTALAVSLMMASTLYPQRKLLGSANELGFLLMLALFVNVLPDYVSLLETRYVLGRMGRDDGPISWLCADLILTTLIAVLALVFILFFLHGILVIFALTHPPPPTVELAWHDLWRSPGKADSRLMSHCLPRSCRRTNPV
jgi:hypothetical protein